MNSRYTALLALALGLSQYGMATTTTPNTGDQPQGFMFSFPLPNMPNSLTLPLIQACPNSLTVSSLSTTNNPDTSDPIAPYTMTMLVHEQLMDGANKSYERIYSRTMDVGDMSVTRSFPIPWMNGTQMIACTWAANGVSGGCQDLMTVVNGPGSDIAFANATSECRTTDSMASWVTPPEKTLNAQVSGVSGNLASNGWPSTCSDISVTPQNGTAPFTLVIAPAFHPPVNITSNDMSAINYTVKLTHGQAFMIGLYDSAGNSFAYGPLHAGDAEDVTCLATLTGQTVEDVTGKKFTVGVLAGGVGGAFVLGAVVAVLLSWCMWRKKKSAPMQSDSQILLDPYADPRPASYRVSSNHSAHSSTYRNPSDPFSPDPYDPEGTATPRSHYDAEYPITPNDPNRTFRRRPTGGYANPFERSGSYRDEFGGSPVPPDGAHRDSATYPGAGGPRRWSDRSRKDEVASWEMPGGGRGSPPGGRRSPPRDGMGMDERERHRSLSPSQRPRNVYVVHSDAGSGDVHIRLPDGGGNVIELPPDYTPDPRREGSPNSRRSVVRSLSERERMEAEYLDFGDERRQYRPSPRNSGGSGRTEVGMSPQELRARAEAAMREKERMERLYGGQR